MLKKSLIQPLTVFELFVYLCTMCSLNRDTFHTGSIEKIQVRSIIGMREDIPHSCHIVAISGYFWRMSSGTFFISFARNGKFIPDCADGLLIFGEFLKGHPRGEFSNLIHCFKHVPRIDEKAPHTYFTSARTAVVSSFRRARAGMTSTRVWKVSSK